MIDTNAADVTAGRERGRLLRRKVPRSSHGEWSSAPDRPDPVRLIEEQNETRLPWLVPVRRARMSVSPFTFYRGTARIMASDLAPTPISGLHVQLCGDAHLSNFGVYASPERRLVFDLTDFDETFRGPFEWDLKRLAASFAIAGQHRGFETDTCRELAVEAASAYRTGIAGFASRGWLDAWYSHLPIDELVEVAKQQGMSKKRARRIEKFSAKAKTKTHLQAARKLVEPSGDGYRFVSDPPLLTPLRDLPLTTDPDRLRDLIATDFANYRSSLDGSIRWLLDRYRLVDLAIKVVGVGSVGTRCIVALLLGREPSDVLILQSKEATRSVLEDHLPPGSYQHSGRRVVEGQRLIQAASDIFLGWSEAAVSGRHYYWRQLKDWKGSADPDEGSPKGFARYARLCGFTLARAHSVSGDPAAITGYLGKGDVFDDAIGEFSVRYADQNLADHTAFVAAINDGDLEAHFEA